MPDIEEPAKKRDYRATLNLPQTDFPMRGSLPQREPEQVARWLKDRIYYRMIEKNRTAKTIADSLGQTPLRIQKLQLSHFKKADPEYASKVAALLGKDQHPEYLHGPDAAELAPAGRLPEK